MAYVIDKNECVACGVCAFTCYFDAVNFCEEGRKAYYEIDAEKCKGCALCAEACMLQVIAPAAGHKQIERVSVIAENCIGCSLCARVCPVNALKGVIKQPYTVDQDRCIRCGACAEKCKKAAIDIQYRA